MGRDDDHPASSPNHQKGIARAKNRNKMKFHHPVVGIILFKTLSIINGFPRNIPETL